MPAQPVAVVGNVLASDAPVGAVTRAEISSVLPRQLVESPIMTQPAVGVARGEFLSAVPTQLATAPNVLTCSVRAAAMAWSTSATSSISEVAAAPAAPAITVGSVVASAVLGVAASRAGSGVNALIQLAEQLSPLAGEGLSAAVEAVPPRGDDGLRCPWRSAVVGRFPCDADEIAGPQPGALELT